MLEIITKFQNKEFTLAMCWDEYGKQIDASTKENADQVYDFLYTEYQKPLTTTDTYTHDGRVRFVVGETLKNMRRKE